MAAMPSLSFAEAWQVQPMLGLESRYDSNIRLASGDNAEARVESLARGSLRFRRLTGTSKIEGRYNANINTNRIGRIRQHFTFSSYKKSERNKFLLAGLFRRDTTTRTIERDQNEEGNVLEAEVDAGLTQIELKRMTLEARPKWEYLINERSSFALGYSYKNVSYSNNEQGTNLFAYAVHGVAPSIVYRLSERDRVGVSLDFSRYLSSGADTKVDSEALNLDYGRALSQTNQTDVSLGVRRSSTVSGLERSSRVAFLLRANTRFKLESGNINATVQRRLSPSATGNLTELSEILLRGQYKLRERLNGRLFFRVSKFDSSNALNGRQRYFFRVSPSISWNITRWWNVRLGYAYRLREEIDSLNDADSHAVFFQLNYSKETFIN